MLERLKRILEESTGNRYNELTPETNFKTDLGLTSLDLAEIVTEIEDEFDIEIPDKVLIEFKTVGDVLDFIKRQ